MSTREPKVEQVAIYALCCPDSGSVRYIGKANNAQARYKSHLTASKSRKTPVYCWIRKLATDGKAPVMQVLELVESDWQEAERRLIAEYRIKGKLLNVAEGGDEPFCPTSVRVANSKKMQS